jgi:hypothetical protein
MVPIQLFLLICQSPPRCFHPQEGKLRLLVFAAPGKEGTVLSVITENISQIHTR